MRRHSLDPLSLAFGLMFSVLAVVSLAGALDASASTLRWGGAALLLVFGVVLLVSARGRGDQQEGQDRDIS